MLRHVSSLAEIVEDVNESLAFYRDTLGMEVLHQNEEDYAVLTAPGLLHFGIWNRAHAAESIYGSREDANRVPLGFALEFEVDDVDIAAEHLKTSDVEIDQKPRLEPWGQKTMRMLSPSGAIVGFVETPWARKITTPMEVEKGDA